MVDYFIGDTAIGLPDDATPDQIKEAITKFRTKPEFDAMVDKKAGAPARVRMLVGSAAEQDKLANLKRFYPDAVPYGEDNFVFTDPGSGRPTLYNPTKGGLFGTGLEFGDVAGVAREGAVAVGSTLGAVAGAGAGLLTGPGAPVAVPTGAVTGAGVGAAAGGALFDASADLIGGRIDTRNIGQMTLDTALDFGGGAVGQRAGELLSEGAKAVFGGAKTYATQLVDAFKSLKIEPPGGAVTGSKALQTVEKMLENSPFSAGVMQENAEKILAQTKQAADTLAADFGQVQTKQGAGQVIKEASVRAAERFGFRQEQLYKDAFDMIGADTPVAVDSIKALRLELQAELAKAPQARAGTYNPVIAQLRAIEDDAAKGGIPFDALRGVRTDIGRDLDSPLLAGATSSQNTLMKRVYGALTEDMSEAAQATGPEAAKKLAAADRYTRMFMNTSAQTLDKIARFDADERAFEFAMTSSRDGGTALARLRRNFEPEEWDTVAATTLSRMGLARAGAQDATGDAFSVSTFLTNWNKLSPEARGVLFGGGRYKDLQPALDNLVKVVGSLKEVEKLTNTSNTARNMIAFTTLQTLGGGLGGLMIGGDGQDAFLGAIGTAVAPRVAAKLITNPSFVKWLTTPVTNPNGISAHMGRLTSIASAEPEVSEEIGQFLSALRSAPARAVPNELPTPVR